MGSVELVFIVLGTEAYIEEKREARRESEKFVFISLRARENQSTAEVGSTDDVADKSSTVKTEEEPLNSD